MSTNKGVVALVPDHKLRELAVKALDRIDKLKGEIDDLKAKLNERET